jgi:hypothetical protein
VSGFRIAISILLLGLIASGCESDTGVEIIIRAGDTDSKWVELFIGEDLCPDEVCTPSWTTEDGHTLTSPQAFTHPRAFPLRAEVKNGAATFKILPEPGHEGKTVLVVGAVGFDGTERYEKSNVTGAHLITTTFDAKGPTRFDETLTDSDALDVDVWGQASALPGSDDPPERCVAFGSEQIVIVPDDDPDCDGLTDEKCYAQNPNNPETPTYCIGDDVGDKCVFGTQTCDNATGQATKCQGTAYPPNDPTGAGVTCFPQPVCQLLSDCSVNPGSCRGALAKAAAATDTCTLKFGVGGGGSNTGPVLCDSTVEVPLPFSAQALGKCKAARVAAPVPGELMFDGEVDLLPPPDTAKLEVSLDPGTCTIRLKATGTLPTPFLPQTATRRVVIRVDLMNEYSLWIPFDLHFTASGAVGMMCDQSEDTCEPIDDDASLLACAMAP